MTLPFYDEVICSVCGTEVEVSGLGSTNSFGSPDLDMRPPEMMRSTMVYWIDRCPNCGYVANDLTKPILVPEAFLKSEQYLSFGDHEPVSELGGFFIQRGRISSCAGDAESAMNDYLYAAWCADDTSDEYWSKQARLLSLEEMEKLGSITDETILAQKADLLRKTGQFEQLIAEYESKNFEDELIAKIIVFQLMKAEEQDTRTVTVDEAIAKM